MEDYPPEYVASNHPLVVLSGLGPHSELDTRHSFLRNNAYQIHSESPLVSVDHVDQLRDEFLAFGAPPDERTFRAGSMNFRFQLCGRDYWLPCRKALQSPAAVDTISTSLAGALHSPLSPLSPGSPLSPDGIMTPLWSSKHLYIVPAVFVFFFSLYSEPNRDSLHDEHLRNDIAAIKKAIVDSKYKCRFVAVLLSQSSLLQSHEVDQRLEAIRKATGLDVKNSFFALSLPAASAEIAAFATSTLSAIHLLCQEYYRDLTRHSRRKKNKISPASVNVGSQANAQNLLASFGWTVRYEYKLGFFAEFRQEWDVASQHYTTSIDAILQNDGVLEVYLGLPSRFVEIRLLADSAAIRTIRSLLRSKMTRMAVASWINYRHKMCETLGRLGKDTSSYGWRAWEARWANDMAHLVQNDCPTTILAPIGGHGEFQCAIYVPRTDTPSGPERESPWECLHHQGYWLKLCAKFLELRRSASRLIPEEDRTPPDQTTASNISRRAKSYDTYLCPEPHVECPLPGPQGFNHSEKILTTQALAIHEFSARRQTRMADYLKLSRAKELLLSSEVTQAIKLLLPLWESNTWRGEGWWTLLEDLNFLLLRCATLANDAYLQLATTWELLNDDFESRDTLSYDLLQTLQNVSATSQARSSSTAFIIDGAKVRSFLKISFAFRQSEGHMGEPACIQIQLRSKAQRHSTAIRPSRILLEFDGPLLPIEIQHVDSNPSDSYKALQHIQIDYSAFPDSNKFIFKGAADLTLRPGQVCVLESQVTFTDTGTVSGSIARLVLQSENSTLCYQQSLRETGDSFGWWYKNQNSFRTQRVVNPEPCCVKVLPKPPKLEISFPDINDHYYSNENINIDVELFNNEAEPVEASVEFRLLGNWLHGPRSHWLEDPKSDHGTQSDLPGRLIGILAAGVRRKESIVLELDMEAASVVVEVKVLYRLVSDPETPVSKTLSADFTIIDPFEANYQLMPCLHPDPWPYFFEALGADETDGNVDTSAVISKGLTSRWLLITRIVSFASEQLSICDVELVSKSSNAQTYVSSTRQPSEASETSISPGEQIEREFSLDVKKHNLLQDQSPSIEQYLKVYWRRQSSRNLKARPFTTISLLSVPDLNTTTNEPRVLATCVSRPEASVIHLDCVLENPSIHYLSFNIVMDSSDDFAFAGPRMQKVHILPISRYTFRYSLVPSVRGQFVRPRLKVMDIYFNKALTIYSNKPLEADQQGLLLWVDIED